MITLLYKLT